MVEIIKNKNADHHLRNNDNNRSQFQKFSLANLSQDNVSSPKKLNELKEF